MGQTTGKSLDPIDLSLNHPKFRNSRLVFNEKQKSMQTVSGVDNKEYDKWKDNLASLKLNPDLLLLPTKQDFSTKGICGSSGTLTLDFPYFPYLLTEEIETRAGKKKLFEESELWHLLYALISAKKDMKPTFSKVGDIRPHNVFINDQGEIKVSNIHSWPKEQTNFQKALDKESTYLAPEEVNKLSNGAIYNEDTSESEIFSIGLTLLNVATLTDFLSVYNLTNFTMNLEKINDKLNEFKLNRAYSDILKGVVCNLCEFDPSRRVASEELYNWLYPFEQSIKSRENFFIPGAPEKINAEVATVRHSVSSITNSHLYTSETQQVHINIPGQRINFPPPIIRTSVPQTISKINFEVPQSQFVNSYVRPETSSSANKSNQNSNEAKQETTNNQNRTSEGQPSESSKKFEEQDSPSK